MIRFRRKQRKGERKKEGEKVVTIRVRRIKKEDSRII